MDLKISSYISLSLKKLIKKFSYEIKIADFYFNDTASLLVDRIIIETTIKDAKIKKINEKKLVYSEFRNGC